ncbi:MAG: hypothetical protein IPO21_10725 [Bacteroidales bacterium]|nr:hypothetical protein [Bacteroidales bacterium]
MSANELIEKIECSFQNINSKINKLNNCSSADFKSLADSFKNSYSKIQELTQNIKLIFAVLNDNKKEEYLELINSALKYRFKYFEGLFLLLKDIQNENQKDIHKRNSFCIDANNIKQSINTFKFLLANLHLKENSLGRNNIESDYINFKTELEEVYESAKVFIDQIKENEKQIIRISKNQKIDIVLRLSHINELSNQVSVLLNEKYNIISNNNTLLDAKSSIYTDSFSKIITNLQYQDIIRQKIEHIYEAHNSALLDISKLNPDETQISKEQSFSFGQVKEISEIQAAQLIHANKDYQNAINVILEKFKDITVLVEEVSELGNLFYGNSTERTFLFDIKELVEVSSSFFLEISNLKILVDEILEIYDKEIVQLNIFRGKILLFRDKCNLFKTVIHANSKQTNEMFYDFVEDIVNQINVLNVNFEKYSLELSKLINDVKDDNNVGQIQSKSKDFIKSYNNLLQVLENEDNQLLYNIRKAKLLGNEIVKNIGDAINSVKFYSYFEKIVEEIIMELEEVRTNILSEGYVNTSGEHLIKLRDLYTMQTERDVHEAILKGDEVAIESSEKEDEDNLELF